MPLSLQEALNAYGFVGQLAAAIPDLRGIFEQAAREGWVPEQVKRAVEDSPWYRTNADAVRRQVTLQAMDPATYAQNLGNARHKISLIANEMGREVNLDHFALASLLNNYDEEQIRSEIGVWGTLVRRPEGGASGQAAQLQEHMEGMFANYGVPFTRESLDGWTWHIQAGRDTLDGFEAMVRARAKAQFPHLANQIDAGMSVRDIADPYIASYAQTLEVSETSVGLNDPAIQRALQVRSQEGAFTNKPMYEFVRELKNDPRWDKTKNAEEEAYRMVDRLGRDMGFLS